MTEKITSILKSIQNFLKMYSEETCELIKINYWNSLENTFNKCGVEPNEINNMIFLEIFKKNFSFINDKNLTFLIFNYCYIKSTERNNMDHADNFFSLIYEFLDNVIQNYDNIFSYVKEYILEYSINLLCETQASNFDFSESRKSYKIINKYFGDFLEIDFPYFSTNLMSIPNQIAFLIKNNVFKNVFKKYSKSLFLSNSFSNLIFLQNLIFNSNNFSLEEKINILLFFFELTTQITKSQDDNSMIYDEMAKIFYFEILKNSFSMYNLPNNHSIDKNLIEQFNTNLDDFLLFILENSKSFANLILENSSIFIQFISHSKDETVLSRYKRIFPLTGINLLNNVNSFSSMEKLSNITKGIKINYSDIKSKIIIKMIQKIFVLNGKIKNFTFAENFQVENLRFFSNVDDDIKNDFNVNYKKDIFNYYNISNLNVLGCLIEKTIREINNKFIFDNKIFYEILEVLLSLKYEDFDTQLQNEMIKNILIFIFVVFENLEGGLDFSNIINKKIFDLLFSYFEKKIKSDFAINEIYPILIIMFQTIFFPKIKFISDLNVNSDNLNILKNMFNYLLLFGRIDSIANLTSKFLISILNTPLTEIKIKVFGLEKLIDLIIFNNTSKFYLLYFNHAMDAIKKLSISLKNKDNNFEENLDLLNTYYYSLWYLGFKYEGNLPFEISNYFINKYEECLNKLTDDQLDFDHIVAIEVVNYMILKDQNEILFEKILENVLSMKFMKIFDKLFQKSKNIEEKVIKFMDLFLIDDNKFYNYDLKLNILFNKNTDLINRCNDPDFLFTLLIIILSRLFSGFISNLIFHNKDKFDIKNFSEKSNSAIASIIKTFDYISASLIFIKDEEKCFSHLIFLNEMFSNTENLNFFCNTHSYLLSMENIEKNNLDYSMINETNMKIINEKNKNLFFYAKYNDKGIFFFKKPILNLFTFEINSLSILHNKSYVNNSKNNIINSIYLDSIRNYLNMNHNANKNISTLFLKYILDSLQNFSEIKTDFNKNLYYLCLTERVFENYLKNCIDLLNIDIINLSLYNLIISPHKMLIDKTTSLDEKKKLKNKINFMKICFIEYLSKYCKISKNCLQFSLRILGNSFTFKILLTLNQENRLEIPEKLFSLIDTIITTVLYFNSYNTESYENIVNILENIKKVINFKNYSFLINLACLGKILSNLHSSLTIKKKLEGVDTEINKKLKDQLCQIVQNDFLGFYLEQLFDIENICLIEMIKKDFEQYNENIHIFKNFKKIKLIKENNNEINIKKFEEMEIFKIFVYLTDLNIPTYIHHTLSYLILYYKKKDENFKMIIENFLNINLSIGNKKLSVDFMKNLIFSLSKELSDKEDKINFESNLSLWDIKFKILNYILYDFIIDENALKLMKRKDLFDVNKIEIIKNIVGFLHFNIINKSGLKSTIFERFNDELVQRVDEDVKDYMKKLNII